MMNTSKKLRNCKQKKCGFMIMGIGCRPCEECGAEPYLVDDNLCTRCWNCENDEGILRWDDTKPKTEEKELVIAKLR